MKKINYKTITTIFSVIMVSLAVAAPVSADHGKGNGKSHGKGYGHSHGNKANKKKRGKNKVELCHAKDNGDYKLVKIPLFAALRHMENHDDDFFPETPGDCTIEVDNCPLTDAEISLILTTFELPSISDFSPVNDANNYCGFSKQTSIGEATMLFGARVNLTDVRMLLNQTVTSSGSDTTILAKDGLLMSNQDARACAAKFNCVDFPAGTVNP